MRGIVAERVDSLSQSPVGGNLNRISLAHRRLLARHASPLGLNGFGSFKRYPSGEGPPYASMVASLRS